MVAAALVGAAGCGDNSRACGPNTKLDDQGYCVPDDCGPGTAPDPNTGLCVPDGSVICSNGTKLDPSTGHCVIDPGACQDGTVLLDGRCVDPSGMLHIDLEEGPEPNGLGVIEPSLAPAGTVTLAAIGGPGFTIHGRLVPFQDADGDGQMDPDVDTYTIMITQPTLVHVTADGVNGIDAGFLVQTTATSPDPLASWVRYGMNVTSDTSKRQLYLPAAGTYVFSIADTRTLFQSSTGGPVEAAPGPGDYYVTIDTLAIPAPTTLAETGGTATTTGTIQADADVQFFTATMGTGTNELTLAMPAVQAVGSLVLANPADQLLQVEDEPVDMLAGGFTSTDQPLIAVDTRYNTAIDPVAYTLTVTTH